MYNAKRGKSTGPNKIKCEIRSKIPLFTILLSGFIYVRCEKLIIPQRNKMRRPVVNENRSDTDMKYK